MMYQMFVDLQREAERQHIPDGRRGSTELLPQDRSAARLDPAALGHPFTSRLTASPLRLVSPPRGPLENRARPRAVFPVRSIVRSKRSPNASPGMTCGLVSLVLVSVTLICK